jgi:hypothetical protein
MPDIAENTNKGSGGGPACAGGISFQATVSAIAVVYMARGKRLSWLEKEIEDIPVAVSAETGGAGDDIRIELKSGRFIEAQVKAGLKSGPNLWEPLTKMAIAIHSGSKSIDYGVLIVAPGSSRTITEDLAKDIKRLGDGRYDHITKIANQWKTKLQELELPVMESCQRIRIQTSQALPESPADIRAACSELGHLCADEAQVSIAWDALQLDALNLIRERGRRDVSAVLRLLKSKGVRLVEKNPTDPSLLLDKLTKWTLDTTATFSILGIQKKLQIDQAWIPLRAVVQQKQPQIKSLEDSLNDYQNWHSRSSPPGERSVNPESLAWFIPRVVLIGGPGMGKTTMLKRIARRYCAEQIPILRLRLMNLAQRMQRGDTFEESLFELALDGSGIASSAARQAAFPNWVLMCDGLDECDGLQENVALSIVKFAAGHPGCRIIVTTRPVGYETACLSDWRHYTIAPLDTFKVGGHLALLVEQCAQTGASLTGDIQAVCSSVLEQKETENVVTRSVLCFGLAAALLARGSHLCDTKEKLVEQIFTMIDQEPFSRQADSQLQPPLLNRFLEILGWHQVTNPLSAEQDSINYCAEVLAGEMATTPLHGKMVADGCLQYWLKKGVLEKIGHDRVKTLVFIHKSFGEFSAARYLKSMPRYEQELAIMKMVNIAQWVEVARFAASLGLAGVLCKTLVSSEALPLNDSKRLALALELMITAGPALGLTHRDKIIGESFRMLSAERSVVTLDIAKLLVSAARCFPEDLGPRAVEWIHHNNSWVRMIAWATAVAAGPGYYCVDHLAETMRGCFASLRPWESSKK